VILRCGLSRGNEKRCGAFLDVFSGFDVLTHAPTGARSIVGFCPEHGALDKPEAEVDAAIAAGRPELYFTHHVNMRVRRGATRGSHNIDPRGLMPRGK
jgi:hypothetical protein